MAREVILRDDIDGSYDDVRTCVLTWQDVTVEVDLSAANRAVISEALAPALSAGTRQRRPAASRPARQPRPTRAQSARRTAVRAWAASNDLDVPARGPIPEEIDRAYAAATEQQHDPT